MKKNSKYSKKIEQLQKGSLQRRNKFNPRQIPGKDIETLSGWQAHSDTLTRLKVPDMPEGADFRAKHKLHGLTQVKRHPETGERMFLLHRGVGEDEFKNYHQKGTRYDKTMPKSSWTPKYDIAHNLAEQDADEYNSDDTKTFMVQPKVVSAWIPESKFNHIPNQTLDPLNNQYKEEHEVIVHHSPEDIFEHADPNLINNRVASAKGINQRISVREPGEFEHKQRVKQKWGKLAASEKYSERIEQLQKGMRGDWKQEGYSFKHKAKPRTFKDLKGNIVQAPTEHEILARDKEGNLIGTYQFNERHDKGRSKEIEPYWVNTEEPHRRKGLATEAYRMMQGISGKPIANIPRQRNEFSNALWSQRNRPFGKSEEMLKYEGKLKSFRNAAAGLATAASLATAQPAMAQEQALARTPQSIEQTQPQWSKDEILRSIAMVESSGGKNTDHDTLPKKGLHRGESAYGSYGLTPLLIRETAKKHERLRTVHPDLQNLRGSNMHDYLTKNPQLEHELASAHYDRLAKIFGHDPSKIAYAWLNGITGTKKALKRGQKLDQHWHVQKIQNALKGLKKD